MHGFLVVYRLTSVYSNPEFQFVFRLVSYCKVFFHRVNEMKCHTSDLASVFVTIPYGKPRYHHVRVTDCLHLPGRRSALEYNNNNKYTELEVERVKRFNINFTQTVFTSFYISLD